MNQYFYEDQVYTVDKKGVKFGLVVENEVIFSSFSFRFFLFSRSIFPTLIFFLYELSIFLQLVTLSIKQRLFRIFDARHSFIRRFLAMGNTRIIPNRKSFCGRESWGLVAKKKSRTFSLILNCIFVKIFRWFGIPRARMKSFRREMWVESGIFSCRLRRRI